MSESTDAIFCPSKGMIACVLLQAVYGGNTSIPSLFDTDDWLLAPDDGFIKMSATRAEWQRIAAMSRPERVKRWNVIVAARSSVPV